MGDTCPTCDHAFEGISDYPIVYVAKFVRLSIPSDMVMPDDSEQLYYGPTSHPRNKPEAPQEVLNFFRDNRGAEEFEHGCSVWQRTATRDSEYYLRTEIADAKDVIFTSLNPYFDTLEGLLGKEVPTGQVLPPFEHHLLLSGRGNVNHWPIPQTSYYVILKELDGEVGIQISEEQKLHLPKRFLESVEWSRENQMAKMEKLIAPYLETPQSTRKLAFILHSAASGERAYKNYFAVGGLAYEGRLRR